jgi:hypothetical protein
MSPLQGNGRSFFISTGGGSTTTTTYECSFVGRKRTTSSGHTFPLPTHSKVKKRKYKRRKWAAIRKEQVSKKRVQVNGVPHDKSTAYSLGFRKNKSLPLLQLRTAKRVAARIYKKMLKQTNGNTRIAKKKASRFLKSIRHPSPEFLKKQVAKAQRRYKAKLKYLFSHHSMSEDLGGEFYSASCSIDPGGVDLDLDVEWTPGWHYKFKGKQYAYLSSFTATDGSLPSPSTDSELDAMGSKLMARAIPTISSANVGQFLGELAKDGIPKIPLLGLIRDRAHFFRDLSRNGSNEYLNIQFGWRPFIRDLLDIADLVRNFDTRADTLFRNSGKIIHRSRLNYGDDLSTTITDLGTSYGALAATTWLFPTPGKLTKTQTTKKTRWFSGSFMYYLPKPDWHGHSSLGSYIRAADALLGVSLTPDLVWKLAPWSWAIDWFTNAGSLIRNWSSFSSQSLLLHHGYMMENIITHSTYNLQGLGVRGHGKINLTQDFVYETKSRRKATPYGFGLNPDSFTAFQWSIIGALGLSKRPKSLVF